MAYPSSLCRHSHSQPLQASRLYTSCLIEGQIKVDSTSVAWGGLYAFVRRHHADVLAAGRIISLRHSHQAEVEENASLECGGADSHFP